MVNRLFDTGYRILCTLSLVVAGLIITITTQAQNSPTAFLQQLNSEQKAWLEAHPVIHIGAMNDWPPIDFINSQGKSDGIGAAYITAINSRLGGRLQLINGEWPVLYQAVIDQHLDALLDLTPKPERQPYFNFTSAYLNIPHVIVAKDTSPYYTDENDLTGKTLALEKGFGNVIYFRTNYPDINIREYANTAEALDAVVRGEADAYIGNRAVAMYIIKSELIQNLKLHGRALKPGSILTIGVRKDWPILTQILDLALKDLSTAEKTTIQSEWVGTSNVDAAGQVMLTTKEKAWLQQHPVIRLASKGSNPPFEYTSNNGGYRGIAADYMRLIEKRLNIRFERSPVAPWDQLVDQVKQRDLDVLSFVTATNQYNDLVLFSKPYLSAGMVIVTKDSVRYIASINGLSNQPIATETDSITYQILHPQYPQLQFLNYQDTDEALSAVAKGDAFAYIGNIATTSYIMRDLGLTNLVISGELPYRYQFAIGVRSDWPELATILNKTLDGISEEERSRIFNQWISVTIPHGIPVLWLIGLAVVALLAVTIISYWNYLLNKKVADRTQQLEYRALHDQLTHLPNRISVLAHMRRLLERTAPSTFAVLFLDLDDFKKINDSLGHAVGDQLLKAVAKRLQQNLQSAHVIGRFGGDEFVILLDQPQDATQVQTLARQIITELQQGFIIDDRALMITTSIGVALYPNDGDCGEVLLRRADIAMYDAKNRGGNEFSYYCGEMDKSQHKKMTIEEQMLRALDHNEMYLVYQPIVNVITNETQRFEALLRWENPMLGLVPPDEFIPVAEQNGYILKIGDFVFQQAIAECRQLQRHFKRDFSISVNLSPRQFRDKNLLNKIASTLDQYQLAPENLVLEITEGVLLSDTDLCGQILNALKALGIHIAMDDFGKGYSSLSYVRNHPFDIIKIDREFVRDIASDHKDRQLVETTIAMSKSLNLEVIAEGVENQAQVMVLRNSHCKYAQGYLFAKPMTSENLYAWLSQQRQQQVN